MTTTLEGALATAIREKRADHGWSQDDLAARARAVGLDWNRATVATIERGSHATRGHRRLSASELLLLPYLLNSPLRTLLPREGLLHLAGVEVPATYIQDVVAGRHGVRVRLAPKAKDALKEAAEGTAERKAARSLDVDPIDVAIVAMRLWGQSLTAERERRFEDRIGRSTETGGVAKGAARTLRGHITRELLAELREDIEEED